MVQADTAGVRPKGQNSDPKERVHALDDELASLEERRERASGAIRDADNELSRIKARQDAIAVAVIAEDDSAVSENTDLEERLIIATRRANVARSACSQLEQRISEAKAEREKAVRDVHTESYHDLARRRYQLEKKIEAP